MGAWSLSPYLAQFANSDFTYGYVAQDFTMYPILPPGVSFQVDESGIKWWKGRGVPGIRTSHLFCIGETRDGYFTAVGAACGARNYSAAHPLSPVR